MTLWDIIYNLLMLCALVFILYTWWDYRRWYKANENQLAYLKMMDRVDREMMKSGKWRRIA